MEYICDESNGQLYFETEESECLNIPSCLYGFKNEKTSTETAQSGRTVYCFRGHIAEKEEDRICKCGKRMHINAHPNITLRHLRFGGNLSFVLFPHNEFKCPACGTTRSQFISFKAAGHRMTEKLYQYTRDLLALGTYTNKQVAELTGLGKNTVKAIDKKRLQELYTIDGKKLIRPEKTARILGIDEFKLQKGRQAFCLVYPGRIVLSFYIGDPHAGQTLYGLSLALRQADRYHLNQNTWQAEE